MRIDNQHTKKQKRENQKIFPQYANKINPKNYEGFNLSAKVLHIIL